MRIKLNKGGFNALPKGWYTFKVIEVDDSKYSKFGKLAIKLQTADGREHVETFTLTKPNGEVNEGAINALSYFAHTCLNDFQVEDFDTDELVGRFIRAEIVHTKSDKINEKTGKPYINVNLGDKEPALGFEDGDGDEGDDDLDDLDDLE